MQADRPQNYDKSLGGFTPDWKGGMNNPDPNLRNVKDFGSASHDVLKESRKAMPSIGGTSAHHGDMTGRTPQSVSKTAISSFHGSFSTSQTPNTSPNYPAIGSKVCIRKVAEASKSSVFHGSPSQKKL